MISWPPPLPHGIAFHGQSVRRMCKPSARFFCRRSRFITLAGVSARASHASVDLSCFYRNSRVGMKVSARRAMESEQPRAPHALLSVLA